MRQIAISVPWDPRQASALLDRARIADEAGVHSIWVNEGFGHDAFSGLTLLAWNTARARLGTAIVNVFSRTPGALAQQFATIDQLSEGRVIVGLGTSAPGAIERFHGVPYRAPLARLRETVELVRAYWRHDRASYAGEVYAVDRPLPLGVDPVQTEPPVYLATLHPRSVQLTAEIADGWLPAWIPLERLPHETWQLRAWAQATGRDPSALTVRAPGTVTVARDAAQAEAIRHARRQALAFFVARNGDFYYRQFGRQGLADEAAAIRRAWGEGGHEAAVAAIPEGMAERFDFVGELPAALERLDAQAEAGADLHHVHVVEEDPRTAARILERLVD
ncbi:MAG: LLM class flavin-dependent oxidoreductase [Chloroflexi bacterium]|nr:LLM class flavin-dependent oxidoreductase [Chloroflexota bacterium]